MKKNAAVIHHIKKMVENNPQDFWGCDSEKVRLFLDVDEDPNLILKILEANPNKFLSIVRLILLDKHLDSQYKIEKSPVTAMKFIGTPNSRIYCLDECPKGQKRRVVMAHGLWNKNEQKNDKEINQIIDNIKETEYTYYQSWQEYEKTQQS